MLLGIIPSPWGNKETSLKTLFPSSFFISKDYFIFHTNLRWAPRIVYNFSSIYKKPQDLLNITQILWFLYLFLFYKCELYQTKRNDKQ